MNIDAIMRMAPVIPVLTIEEGLDPAAVAETLVAAGLPVIEVTLRTPTALDAIRAMAKVDMRLVPDQDPNEIFGLLRKHLDANGFEDIEAELLGPEPPGRTSLDAPIARVVSETWTELTGRDSILTPTAQGTGPWHQLCDALGIEGSTAGSGHPASGAHAADWTPTSRSSGRSVSSAVATPEARPPPPTGITTVARPVGSCPASSRPSAV